MQSKKEIITKYLTFDLDSLQDQCPQLLQFLSKKIENPALDRRLEQEQFELDFRQDIDSYCQPHPFIAGQTSLCGGKIQTQSFLNCIKSSLWTYLSLTYYQDGSILTHINFHNLQQLFISAQTTYGCDPSIQWISRLIAPNLKRLSVNYEEDGYDSLRSLRKAHFPQLEKIDFYSDLYDTPFRDRQLLNQAYFPKLKEALFYSKQLSNQQKAKFQSKYIKPVSINQNDSGPRKMVKLE